MISLLDLYYSYTDLLHIWIQVNWYIHKNVFSIGINNSVGNGFNYRIECSILSNSNFSNLTDIRKFKIFYLTI